MDTLLHILTGTERGGCETDSICLLKKMPANHHHLLVLGVPGEMDGEFRVAGATMEYHNVLRERSHRIIAIVEQSVAETRPRGIVIWHGMVALPEILRALRDFSGEILVHGGNPAHTMPRWVDWWYFLREKALGRRANATYICCSRYVADSFSESLYLRRFPRLAVFNGVQDLTTNPHAPREIAPGDSFTIGMVARLDTIKDHPTLLRAFAILLGDLPNARLELAGDGESRNSLKSLAAELGIRNEVRFLGMVSNVYKTMSHWDAFVYATTDREGLGNALAEAMMLGLPCVVTEAGPMLEMAGTPPSVYLVPQADPAELAIAIRKMITELALRRIYSDAAKARSSSQFTGESFARGYGTCLGMVE